MPRDKLETESPKQPSLMISQLIRLLLLAKRGWRANHALQRTHPMKNSVCLGILLAFGLEQACAQLKLNAGDSYATNLQLRFASSFPCVACYPYAYFDPVISNFGPGDSVLLEVFNNSTSEPPLASKLYNPLSPDITLSTGAWYDNQGALRVSVLSGSVDLNSVYLGRWEPIGSRQLGSYGAGVVFIPESSTSVLMLFGGVLIVAYRCYRKR